MLGHRFVACSLLRAKRECGSFGWKCKKGIFRQRVFSWLLLWWKAFLSTARARAPPLNGSDTRATTCKVLTTLRSGSLIWIVPSTSDSPIRPDQKKHTHTNTHTRARAHAHTHTHTTQRKICEVVLIRLFDVSAREKLWGVVYPVHYITAKKLVVT